MIWFRRIIAIGLIFFALVIFIPALFLTEVNNTAANPEFYNDQLDRADFYNFIYDDALPAALDEIEDDETSDLPIDLEDFKSDVVIEARKIFTPEWLQEQTESVIRALVPYFRGSTDDFTITIPVSDKVDPTADAIIEIFDAPETYDHLLEEIITPKVEEELGSGVDLPFDVNLSQEEISSDLKDVLPYAWIHDSFVEIVRACADYVKGAETISVNIDLADNKAEASDNLTTLADQKLEETFNSLPEVSTAEFLLAIQDLPSGNIPDVRPDIGSYDDFKTAIGLDIGYWVDSMVTDQIPDQWSFPHDDIMRAIGSDLEKKLNDVREYYKSGYFKTEADLRDQIIEDEGNPDDLDHVREAINWGRMLLWVLWVIPLLMLLGAGLLIARSWKGKLLWFFGIVFVMFTIFYIVVGISYTHFTEPEIQTAFGDPAEHEGVEAVMIEKGNEMLVNATDTFFSGIQRMALYTMIASGVAYVGVNLGLRRRKKGEAPQEDNSPVSPEENGVVLLDEHGEVVQDETDKMPLDENTEAPPGENQESAHYANEEAPPDQNAEVAQEKSDEVLQSENEEVLQDENTDFSQDMSDKVLPDEPAESSPGQITSPDADTRITEE